VSKLGHALNEWTFLNAKGAEAFAKVRKEDVSLRSFANNFVSFALELLLKWLITGFDTDSDSLGYFIRALRGHLRVTKAIL